jgi:ubiquinone/menaquinone biosynthesis C-methylase UbiE
MTAANEQEPQTRYPLMQSEEEMQRLALQADALHTQPTRWLFHQAGLTTGMRVLDVGCGAGDGTFLAAQFVGPSGTVVGIDSSPSALDTARLRADRAGLTNVTFIQADLREYVHSEQVDALVGRAVLMYIPDPAATLRNLLQSLRAGGLTAFREVLVGEPFLEATPSSPLIDQLNAWYMASAFPALQAMGVDGRMGLSLHRVFRQAGLPAPQMWMHAPIGCEPGWPGWEYVGHHFRMLGSIAARAGVQLPAGLEPTDLGARIRDEVLQHGGVLRLQRGVQAWVRKPASPT